MDTQTLLRKITALPVIAADLAEDLLAGDFRSIFKGQGMEFDEARHYQPGDDVRFIDWNANARFGIPYVKIYREERELTVLILLDVSASMQRGSFARRSDSGGGAGGGDTETPSPYEQGLISAALIALSAERTGQKTGAFFFDSDIQRSFPPRKGSRHIMSIVSAGLQYANYATGGGEGGYGRSSNINAALNAAARMLKRRGLIVLISDFFSMNWEQQLGGLNSRHDVIAIRISDYMEKNLPDIGLISMEDPETGMLIEAATNRLSFREEWADWHRQRSELWAAQCRRYGIAHLELQTQADAGAALLRFFGSRQHRELS